MRKVLLILLLGVVALILPGTVFKTIAPQLIAPNFMAILLLYLAFHEIEPLGALLAFLLGLQLDFCSGVLLGPWAEAYVIVYALLVLSSQRIFTESPLVIFLGAAAASLFTNLIYHLTLITVYGSARADMHALYTAFVEAALTAVCAPFLFYLFRRKFLKTENGSALRRVQPARG